MEARINELINKFNTLGCNTKELEELEDYIEKGMVPMEQLLVFEKTKKMFENLPTPEPSPSMTERFNTMLIKEKVLSEKRSGSFFQKIGGLWSQNSAFKWAYSIVLVGIGLTAGLLIKSGTSGKSEIKTLTSEVTQMKEMMMLSLLEKESTSDRLKAVNLTNEIPDASKKVTEALIKTLNNDENVNVRLAAIEVLFPYAGDPEVRRGLITSIGKQKSPLVQMALAEMMVALQEKRSVPEFEELLRQKGTPSEVRQQIEESIKVLI